MKYMLLIYTDPATGPQTQAEGEKLSAAYGAFTQEILDSKEFVNGDALQGPDTATAVRVRSGKSTATDGPFAETTEQLGGYYVIDVPDLDRALALAAKIPGAATGGVEVRPVMDLG